MRYLGAHMLLQAECILPSTGSIKSGEAPCRFLPLTTGGGFRENRSHGNSTVQVQVGEKRMDSGLRP